VSSSSSTSDTPRVNTSDQGADHPSVSLSQTDETEIKTTLEKESKFSVTQKFIKRDPFIETISVSSPDSILQKSGSENDRLKKRKSPKNHFAFKSTSSDTRTYDSEESSINSPKHNNNMFSSSESIYSNFSSSDSFISSTPRDTKIKKPISRELISSAPSLDNSQTKKIRHSVDNPKKSKPPKPTSLASTDSALDSSRSKTKKNDPDTNLEKTTRKKPRTGLTSPTSPTSSSLKSKSSNKQDLLGSSDSLSHKPLFLSSDSLNSKQRKDKQRHKAFSNSTSGATSPLSSFTVSSPKKTFKESETQEISK